MFKLKNKLFVASLAAVITLIFGGFSLAPATVSAEVVVCSNGKTIDLAESDSSRTEELCAANGGVNRVEASGAGGGNFEADCKDANVNQENCGIISYLVLFINALSGIVGIVIVIMIAVGGIQYSAARDNPQATAAAKARIVNAITALVFYLFSFAILQWLVPGGIF